jgi:peptide deformylase
MTFREIVTLESEDKANVDLLRIRTKDLTPEDIESKEIQSKIDDLVDSSRNAGGLGLAAPQIGWGRSVFVMEGDNGPAVIINPRLVATNGKAMSYGEGCLSVPGERFDIKRAKSVVITGYDRNGVPFRLKARNKSQAFVIQHEMDHLAGVLICDK